MTTIGSLLVKLGLDGKDFEKGIGSAQAAASKLAKGMESKLGGMAKKFDGLTGGVAGRLAQAIGPTLSGAAKVGAAALGVVIATIGTLVSVAAAATGVVIGLFGAITAGAFALAKAAVPVDGIRRAFEGLTSTIVGGSAEMLEALKQGSDGMIANAELMRIFNQAAQLVGITFAQQLPEALGLLGKVGQATGASLDYLLDSLVRGVGRLSPMILDNLGVTVNLSQAYQDWATASGRTVESMTKMEQQAALTAQVIDKLRQNTANMPEVFGSAGQVFAALGADLKNIKDQVGMDLLPTFTSLLGIVRKMLPAIQAFGSGFAGTFAGIVNVAKGFVRGLARGMGIDFDTLANNAGGWGENIVLQLARGMANAIAAVIAVLNQLGQVIASWLAPGSPPKLLPDIDKWGMETANVWLEGMTQADIGILRDLSGTVENFLRSLPADALGGANIAETILNFRDSIEQALSTGGNVLSAIPQQLQAYAAAFIQVQQAAENVQAATEGVAAAQEGLNAVQQQYSAILDPLRAQLEGISAAQEADARNDRRGVLQAIIEEARANGDAVAESRALRELEALAIQEQILAIEAQEDAAVGAAQEQVDAAQQALDAAEQEQRAAEQRLQMEQELIQHQMETNRLLQEMVEGLDGAAAGAGSAAGGVGGLVDELSNLGGIGAGLGNIGSGISSLAQQIIDAFAPVETAAEGLGATWGGVFGTVMGKIVEWRDLWDSKSKEVQGFIAGFVATVDMKFKEAVGYITGFVTSVLSQFETWKGGIIGALTAVWSQFETWKGVVMGVLSVVIGQLESLKTTAITVAGGVISALTTMGGSIPGALSGALGVINGAIGIVDGLLSAFQALKDFLDGAIFSFHVELPDIPDWAIPGSPLPLHTAWQDFGRFLDREQFQPDLAIAADALMMPVFRGDRLAAGDTAGAGNQPQVVINMGGVAINNDMDEQKFQLRVEQAVMRGLRRSG